MMKAQDFAGALKGDRSGVELRNCDHSARRDPETFPPSEGKDADNCLVVRAPGAFVGIGSFSIRLRRRDNTEVRLYEISKVKWRSSFSLINRSSWRPGICDVIIPSNSGLPKKVNLHPGIAIRLMTFTKESKRGVFLIVM